MSSIPVFEETPDEVPSSSAVSAVGLPAAWVWRAVDHTDQFLTRLEVSRRKPAEIEAQQIVILDAHAGPDGGEILPLPERAANRRKECRDQRAVGRVAIRGCDSPQASRRRQSDQQHRRRRRLTCTTPPPQNGRETPFSGNPPVAGECRWCRAV
ncbi:MAG: hypothetical protein V4531_06300, partial [Actinomycetota bacterium]